MNKRPRNAPLLILSQDYELFFGTSGSVEKCLFEPCDMLLRFARQRNLRISFFIDAGMLRRMRSLAPSSRQIRRELDDISRHIESLGRGGHEIGLHVHPHWEETTWVDGQWCFANTRYQLRDFDRTDAADIVRSYAAMLQELTSGKVSSYRAGGFCVEPFDRIREVLRDLQITIDSSVVPGAVLRDADKGFDFAKTPEGDWWRFDQSPLESTADGEFLEVAVTPLVLSPLHYWRRLVDRLSRRSSSASVGDGESKAIGKHEILRRLLGAGRVSELSLDAAKAQHLSTPRILSNRRPVWHVMGHPKLLGPASLRHLESFMAGQKLAGSESVAGFAASVASA